MLSMEDSSLGGSANQWDHHRTAKSPASRNCADSKLICSPDACVAIVFVKNSGSIVYGSSCLLHCGVSLVRMIQTDGVDRSNNIG